MNFFKKKLLDSVYIAFLSGILYVVIIYIGYINNYTPIEIIKDPVGLKSSEFLFGFISKLNVTLWIIAGSISLFSSQDKINKRKEFKIFLQLGSFYSFYFSISDFTDLHQFKQIFSYLFIIFITLILFLKFYFLIKSISLPIYFFSYFFLGLSLAIDILQGNLLFINIEYSHIQVVEEGFKFIGTFYWLYFWIKSSSFALSAKN